MRPQKTPRKVAEYKAVRAIAHKECVTFQAIVNPLGVHAYPEKRRPRKSGKVEGLRYSGTNCPRIDKDIASVIDGDDNSPEKEEVMKKDRIVTVALHDIARAARPVKAKGIAKEFVVLSPPSRVIALEDNFDPGPSIYEDDWEKV